MSGIDRGIEDANREATRVFGVKAARNEAGFEQWYADNAFDYVRDPVGSRECGLQRRAWHAALDTMRAERDAFRVGMGWLIIERDDAMLLHPIFALPVWAFALLALPMGFGKI